jgi:hypothetical protein
MGGHGRSKYPATFYKWRAKYSGMDDSMMSRMKELEEENRRLKKMHQKSGEGNPTQGDGHQSSQGARHLH